MKRNLFYIMLSCLLFSMVACEDNIEDATSKHKYGEEDSPYLRSDVTSTITSEIAFEVGRFAPFVIQLEDYADLFEDKMNMSVAELITGLENESVVFHNINIGRRIWDKTSPTKGTTGWYYNSAGGITTVDDEFQTTSLDFDKTTKTITIDINESAKAGTILSFNVGFAINGSDYDDYLRFAFNVSVTDPSLIISSVSIPDGNYSADPINLTDHAETIEYNLGLSVEEFLAQLDVNEGGTIKMYVINLETEEWDITSSYTANGAGYWLNNLGEVCSWGDDGFSYYVETNQDEQIINIGRGEDLSPTEEGKEPKIGFGYKDTTDETKFIRFIVTVALE